MKTFPKFDTFSYLQKASSLDALDGLGATILPFDKFSNILSEYEQELYEERAAIMEFDGKMERKEAEQRAYNNIIQLRFERKTNE